MVKKTFLKRIGYAGIALVLAVAAVPIMPNGNVQARAGCPESLSELERAISNGNGTIKLCGNITGNITINRNTAIDLGGYYINGNITIINGRNSTTKLTLSDSVGSGGVGGNVQRRRGNGDLVSPGTDNLVITGGTYGFNPNAYVDSNNYIVDVIGNKYTVKVRPEITESDVVAPAAISVKETETYNLANDITLAEGVEGEISEVSYMSANTGVVGVSAAGVVNGVTVGNTEITATVKVLSYGVTTNIAKTIAVEVTPIFSNFVLNEETNGVIDIKEGQEISLSLKSAETVDSLRNVTIDSVRVVSGDLVRVNGRRLSVRAKSGVGTAKIEVTARYTSGGRTFTLTRQLDAAVKSALTSVEVRDASNNAIYNAENGVELDKNGTKDLRVTIHSNSNAAVTYAVESSDPNIAEISSRGDGSSFRIIAKSAGTANVTVTVTPKNAVNGEGAIAVRFAVKVNPILESITAEDVEIDQGGTGQILAIANDGLMPSYIYRERGAMMFGRGLLNINSDGSFTARDGRYGETTVDITTRQNIFISTSIRVKVNPVLAEVTLADDELTVYEGDTAQIEIASVANEAIRDEVTWSYGGYDHSIIGVSNTGKITPRRDGTTTVTVTGTYVSPLGKTYTATATVNVIVKSKLESIAVEDINIKVGERADFDITVEADDITPRYTYEYSDSSIARNSRAGGVRALKAGDTEVTVTARHFGKTVTATAMVHVYEMEQPTHHHYYGAVGQVFDVHVGDKNTNAYTRASVNTPWAMIVMGDNAIALRPGVFEVTYTDYMANGEKVGEYTAKFTVFRVERETVAVARGETKELDGHSEWSTSSAKDAVTGHHLRVNSKGKTVFTTDENTELGVHDVTMKHMFRYDAREVVKEVTVVVYDVNADPESDPAGLTGDTLKEYIEGMFDNVSSLEDLMARLEATREIFGDGFEGILSVMGLSGAVMGGNEIDTRVEVTKLDEEDVDEAMISAVEALDVDGVEYYDVSVWMASNGVDLGKLHQLNNKIVVALAKVTDPESGYTRQYIVIRQHDGEDPEILVEGVDFYIEDGVLYVISDKFSTYAVAYQDTMIPAYGGVTYTTTIKAPETGKASKQSGVTAQAVDMNIVVAVLGVAAVLLMAGAVVCAKRK